MNGAQTDIPEKELLSKSPVLLGLIQFLQEYLSLFCEIRVTTFTATFYTCLVYTDQFTLV